MRIYKVISEKDSAYHDNVYYVLNGEGYPMKTRERVGNFTLLNVFDDSDYTPIHQGKIALASNNDISRCSKIYEEKEILKEIEQLCRDNQLTYNAVGFAVRLTDEDNNDRYDLIEPFLDRMYDAGIEPSFYVCRCGTWLEGSTPLLQFQKPNV